jgi:hypothetical protein
MSAEDQIKEVLGDARSPARGFGQGRPFAVEAGSDEDRIESLEYDVGKLRDALLLAGRQIDDLASKVITTE